MKNHAVEVDQNDQTETESRAADSSIDELYDHFADHAIEEPQDTEIKRRLSSLNRFNAYVEDNPTNFDEGQSLDLPPEFTQVFFLFIRCVLRSRV